MTRDADRAFIDHLMRLKDRDRGALATLRHSLSFPPGDYPRAFPHVERYVGKDWHANDARRRARYAVAGLYALHPVTHSRSLAAALGQLVRNKERPSLEFRFLALLEADADAVMAHLRQVVSLLAADGVGYDPAGLLADLCIALNERVSPDARNYLRRQWARDFYSALQTEAPADSPPGAGISADVFANVQ